MAFLTFSTCGVKCTSITGLALQVLQKAPQIRRPLRRGILMSYLQVMELIEADNLSLIRDFFQDLCPRHVTILLNSTIHANTLLFTAAILGKLDICRYLMELSLRQGREQLCEIWKTQRHPLTAAILTNNQHMMEFITMNLYDINDTITGLYTPLMLAVLSGDLWFIKRLVSLGADVNLSCGRAGNPLVAACVSRNSSYRSRFLVGKGARIDQQDSYGNTALHAAVSGGQVSTVKYLVETGANVRIRCRKNYTPLILSALKMTRLIFNHLVGLPAYSEMEKVEAVEILNACLVLSGKSDIRPWLIALDMRRYTRPKKVSGSDLEVLELSVEFSTPQELLNIQHSQLLLAYQGVLVVGRVLGFFTNVYIRSIIQTALIAKGIGRLENVRELIEYIQTICQSQNLYSFIVEESKGIKVLFSEIAVDAGSDHRLKNGAFVLFEMVTRAARETWSRTGPGYACVPYMDAGYYFEIIDTFLLMAYTFKTVLPEEDVKKYTAIIQELVNDDPRVDCQQTLLHRAVSAAKWYDWGSVELVQVLLKAGVDVNSKDHLRQTPLIYAVKRSSLNKYNKIIECLLEYGAHLDCQSSEGYYATDFCSWRTLSNEPNHPIDLSCQAVRVILDHHIPYENKLPKIIRNFVDLHK